MAQISIRVDDEVKQNAEQVCEEIGMSISTAINIYLKRLGREGRIPFEVKADRPNKETIEAMEEVLRMKQDPTIGKTYTDVESMMEELLYEV